jgi:hypothetical protein
MRTASLLFLSLAMQGCAPARPLVASRDDYADYRKTRLAPSVPARLAAATLYLERHRDGAWNGEVAEWFVRAESRYYESRKTSPEGVEEYLAALPSGPHGDDARARLASYRANSRAAQAERLARTGAEFERRLQVAAQSREDVVNAYAGWIDRLLAFDGWGRPLDAAGGDVALSFQTDAGAGRCGPRECKRALSIAYELEVSGKPVSFVATIDVTLRLSEAGAVEEAAVSGPDLFLRLFEAHDARPVNLERPEDRRAAARWAAELTAGVAEAHLPQARCDRLAPAPVVLSRACDGLSLEATAAAEAAGDDRVVIRGRAGIKGPL